MNVFGLLPESVQNLWGWVSGGASVWIPVLGEIALWLVIFGLAAIGMLIVVVASLVEDADGSDDGEPSLPALQNLAMTIQAIGGGVTLVGIYFLRHWILDNIATVIVAVAIVFATWMSYVYLQNRRTTSRRETAIRRTQRNVGNTVEDWVQAIAGAVFVIAAIGLSVLSGIFQSAGALDQYLTPLLNEIGFGLLTLLGYVQLGGSKVPGASYIPEMNALQWVGIALMIFAAVVVFRD